jgi:hypothetical protein
MNEGVSEVSIDVVRARVANPDAKNNPFAEEEALEPFVASLKTAALDYITGHDAKQWLLDSMKRERYLDGIVSSMRHVEGEQQQYGKTPWVHQVPNFIHRNN